MTFRSLLRQAAGALRLPPPSAPKPPFTAEECVAAADRAMGDERWPKAIEWLERARRLAPTSARVCEDLAFALERCGLHDEALRMYDEAARLGPNPSEPLFHAAVLAHHAGRNAEAVTRLERVLALDPRLAYELEDLGLVSLRPSGRAGPTRDEPPA